MGIVQQLIQISGVQALRGRTIAGDNVRDSLIASLPYVETDKPQPLVAVSVEDSVSHDSSCGLFRTDVEATMLLQLAIARSVTVEIGENEAAQTLVVGDTDAAYEMSLNLLHRQVLIAFSDPANAWAEILRKLVTIGTIKTVRLADAETGHKHAARLIEMSIMPIAEPSPGQTDNPVVGEALALLAGVADYADIAAILTDSLHAGADLYDWQKVQASLFATSTVPAMIGVGTPDDGEEVPIDASDLVTNDYTSGFEGDPEAVP